jgi:hypothetical protein
MEGCKTATSAFLVSDPARLPTTRLLDRLDHPTVWGYMAKWLGASRKQLDPSLTRLGTIPSPRRSKGLLPDAGA